MANWDFWRGILHSSANLVELEDGSIEVSAFPSKEGELSFLAVSFHQETLQLVEEKYWGDPIALDNLWGPSIFAVKAFYSEASRTIWWRETYDSLDTTSTQSGRIEKISMYRKISDVKCCLDDIQCVALKTITAFSKKGW